MTYFPCMCSLSFVQSRSAPGCRCITSVFFPGFATLLHLMSNGKFHLRDVSSAWPVNQNTSCSWESGTTSVIVAGISNEGLKLGCALICSGTPKSHNLNPPCAPKCFRTLAARLYKPTKGLPYALVNVFATFVYRFLKNI